MSEFISKTDGDAFYTGLALLNKIADKEQDIELGSFIDNVSTQGEITPTDFLVADSNGNDQLDAADNFAFGDPLLLREVSDYVSTYFPEFATDHLQFVPDNLGENADDLATLDDMGQSVTQKVEEEAAAREAELLAGIPPEGTVEELFGNPDSREGFKKRVAIIAIAPLDRSDDPGSETAKVVVTLKGGSTRTVVFREYRTGTANMVFGETIEQAYGRFLVEISETYSFTDRDFFEACQKIFSANHEENIHDLTVGAVAGGVMTAGLITHAVVKTSITDRVISELVTEAGKKGIFADLWPLPDGFYTEHPALRDSASAGDPATLAKMKRAGSHQQPPEWAGLQQEKGVRLYYKVGHYSDVVGYSRPDLAIEIVNPSLALTRGERMLSGLGRAAFWAGLLMLIYEVGKSIYSYCFPTPEEKLRRDISQLVRPGITFGQFQGMIVDKPELRNDLRILAWQMHRQGLM